jgi:hypothetical protein
MKVVYNDDSDTYTIGETLSLSYVAWTKTITKQSCPRCASIYRRCSGYLYGDLSIIDDCDDYPHPGFSCGVEECVSCGLQWLSWTKY